MVKQITNDAALVATEELLIAFAASDEGRVNVMASFPTGDRIPLTWRSTYQGMLKLFKAGKPINIETVTAATGKDSKEFFKLKLDIEKPRKGKELDAAIDIVSQFAKQEEAKRLPAEFEKVLADKGVDAALSFVQERAAQIASNGGKERPSDGVVVLDGLKEFMKDEDRPVRWMTGLKPFDMATLGLGADDKVVLSGKYKGRKSTYMRNVILGLLARGHGCSVALLEGNQRAFLAELWAMVSNSILLAEGHEGQATLFGRRLLGRQTWSKEQYGALQSGEKYLRGVLDSHRLSIYDKKDDIKNPSTIKSFFKRDNVIWQSKVGFLDFGGLLDWGSVSDREHSQMSADWLCTFPDMAIFMLWQENEAKLRGDIGKKSAGLMGGMAVPAAADFIFGTTYDKDDAPNELLLTSKDSRHGDGGQAKAYYGINKYCGVVTSHQKDGRNEAIELLPGIKIASKKTDPNAAIKNQVKENEKMAASL